MPSNYTTPYPASQSSQEMQEIIGTVPPWILRWGITVCFGVMVIILIASNIIRYPDMLFSESMLNARDQPFKMTWLVTDPNVTYQSLVRDTDHVKAGDTLLVEHDQRLGKKTYVKSPMTGKAFVIQGVKDNPKATMMLILPDLNSYEVQLKIPLRGAGKVAVGQRVVINLDAYPANEFGHLEGEISKLVMVSIDNYYRANVRLASGLTTNTGYSIPLQPMLHGTAEIMLNDKTLFRRILAY